MTVLTSDVHTESCVDGVQAMARYMMYLRIGVGNVIK